MFAKMGDSEKDERFQDYLDKLCSQEKTGDVWIDWKQPFFRWWKDQQPDEDLANHMAEIYSNIYGIWDWEDVWVSLI